MQKTFLMCFALYRPSGTSCVLSDFYVNFSFQLFVHKVLRDNGPWANCKNMLRRHFAGTVFWQMLHHVGCSSVSGACAGYRLNCTLSVDAHIECIKLPLTQVKVHTNRKLHSVAVLPTCAQRPHQSANTIVFRALEFTSTQITNILYLWEF